MIVNSIDTSSLKNVITEPYKASVLTWFLLRTGDRVVGILGNPVGWVHNRFLAFKIFLLENGSRKWNMDGGR